MRTVEIKSGSIDVRIAPDHAAICLVFQSDDAQLKLFRTMPIDEARAFLRHCAQRLGEVE